MTKIRQLEQHALFHKALSEPIRLRLLALLSVRESLCVCDLVCVLKIQQSTVSRHLAYLKNQDLVESWREGNWMHYALDNSHLLQEVLRTSLTGLQTCSIIQEDLLALEDYEKTPRECKQ